MPKKPMNARGRGLVLLLAAAVLVAAGPALAVPVRGLYEASVPVPNQSPQAREPALQQAFASVLVRVTGLRYPANEAALQPLLARAAGLVQGYGYEKTPEGLRLKAQFDARAVEAALRQQNQPVWGANRPSHVVWLALQGDGQPRAVLDAAGIAARAPAVAATASARGLVFAYPAQDSVDRSAAGFTEIAAQDHEAVRRASRRYGTDQALAVRAGREAGRWSADWTLLTPAGDAETWSSSGADLETALAEGVHALADRLARRLVVATDRAEELLLQVSGMESLRDYSRVLGYLRGLNPVRSAQVAAVQNGLVTYRLRVEGDPELLARVLASGGLLRRADEGMFSATSNYVLVR